MSTKALGSRRTTAPKPELEYLIALVNLIPPDFEMKSVLELIGENSGVVGPRPGSPQALARKQRMRDAFLDYTAELPKAFESYLWSLFFADKDADDYTDEELNEIADRLIRIYEQVKSYRMRLRDLVHMSRNLPKQVDGEPIKVGVLIYGDVIVEDGKFKKPEDFFADTIDGVEVERLRECERCKRIFWARRKDSRGCSKRCATILRQRNFYNKHYKKEV